eukprot:1212860-Alexandrium_andersonii.AAC.1
MGSRAGASLQALLRRPAVVGSALWIVMECCAEASFASLHRLRAREGPRTTARGRTSCEQACVRFRELSLHR